MTWPLLLTLLWAVAVLAIARCWRRPLLRRAALALVLLAVADSMRFALASPQDGAALRLDVALSMLWPAASAWLIAGWPALAWIAYAVALALWGRHLAPWWGWALRAPRVAVGVLATGAAWMGSRRHDGAPSWTASQRVGLWLAAGQVVTVGADAIERAAGAEGLWARWGTVRGIAALVYVLCAVVVLSEPRAR